MNIGPRAVNATTTSFQFSHMITPIVCVAIAILAFITYVVVRVQRIRAKRELELNDPQAQATQNVQQRQLQRTSQELSKESRDSLFLNSSLSRPITSPPASKTQVSQSGQFINRSILAPPSGTTILTEFGTTSTLKSIPEVTTVEPISQEMIDTALEKIREGHYQEAAEEIEQRYPFEEGVVLGAALNAIRNKINEKNKITLLGEQKVKLAVMTLVQEMLSDENLQRAKSSTTRRETESLMLEMFSRSLGSIVQAMQYEDTLMSYRSIATLKHAFATTSQSLQTVQSSQQRILSTQVQASSLIAFPVKVFDRFTQICEELIPLEESVIQQRIASFN